MFTNNITNDDLKENSVDYKSLAETLGEYNLSIDAVPNRRSILGSYFYEPDERSIIADNCDIRHLESRCLPDYNYIILDKINPPGYSE